MNTEQNEKYDDGKRNYVNINDPDGNGPLGDGPLSGCGCLLSLILIVACIGGCAKSCTNKQEKKEQLQQPKSANVLLVKTQKTRS